MSRSGFDRTLTDDIRRREFLVPTGIFLFNLAINPESES
jgi:hypothetical protein